MKKKVALVNNDADFLNAMEEILQQLGGYEAFIIHEGNTAYHQIKREQPDLIILDIRMEEPTTGWKVLDLLTLDPLTSKIPVIICSASAEQIIPEKQDWLTDHGIAVLPKPFDVNDLIAMVEIHLKPKKEKVKEKSKFLETN